MKLTHPEKILYPEDKLSKQDVLNYYQAACDYILPFIINRPLTLVRCPSNYHECFYQKKLHKAAIPGLYTIEIEGKEEKGTGDYIYIKNKQGLFSLVQMGVLEIHPWGSKINNLEKPDMITIDLDPSPEVKWSKVVAAAFEVKNHLEELNLKSFVKTTGGKGLHVVVPFKPKYDWDHVKDFTHIFVETLEKLSPSKYISEMSKAKRKGKIFVDYLRNQRGATAIAAYSTRARAHATVSTPIDWDELTYNFEDTYYTITTLPKRLEKLKIDPWQEFWKIKQKLP